MPKLISVGGLIDKSWEHYRDNFIDLVSISGWLLLIAILDTIALVFYPTGTKLFSGAALDASEQFGVILFVFAAWVVAPLLGLWVFTSTVRLVKQQLEMRKTNVKAAMKEGLHYFLPALLISILIVLVLLAGILIGVGPGFLLAALASATNASSMIFLANFLVIIGIFVAFVLNIRWSVQFVLAPYSLLLDDKHGVEAMKYSRRLVHGKFWKTLLLLVTPKVVFILFGVVIMALLAFLTNIFINAAAGINIDVQLRLISITSSVYPIILTVLINPLIVITDVLLFNSLKEVTTTKRK